ncbi:Outer membrane receptor proteins, mostly Fe transport [Novosphingobium mathurense]|uniref:Outer membrane receptor proteins, mostly Fe transport n=2 Tax=Novosphingobium mathurense TaxID=428990 RepID=A0A1U6IIZ2_9SPHN|nr:Outer membrane receptor proteins, mostly Fe transport [Novosphingobium mathurense]
MLKVRSHHHLMLGAAAIAVAAVSTPAMANETAESALQVEPSTDGDIVVTAQRRAENMQKVPIAITAITGEALVANGISTTTDVAIMTPGLQIPQVVGAVNPRIRGIGAASAQGGNETPVSIYVDDVYYASSSSATFSLNNIEQVTVLKGPQGTLFGRNATGGLIQVKTRDPSTEFSGKAAVTYGNLNTIGGDLYLTGGLAEGVAADIAVYYQNQQDGFGINTTTGTEVGNSEDLAIRSKLKVDAGEDTTLILAGDYSTVDAHVPSRRLTYEAVPSAGPRFTGRPFDVFSTTDPIFKSKQGGASLTATHDFGAVLLKSITAWRRSTTIINGIDLDVGPLPLAFGDQKFIDRQFTQEVQLFSDGGGALTWSLGAFYLKSRARVTDFTLKFPAFTRLPRSVHAVESLSGFGQATLRLGEATSVTAGIRYSHEIRDFAISGTVINVGGPTVDFPEKTDRQETNEPTWRLAIDHNFSNNLMVYASYNRGFKTGGFNHTQFITAIEQVLPEKLDAYEVGFKSQMFDRALRLNASAYYYDYRDIQLTAFSAFGQRIVNGPKAKIYGLDFDIEAQLSDRLTLTGGAAIIRSEFGTFTNATITTPSPTGGNIIGPGDATGNELPNAPDWTVNAALTYDLPLGFANSRWNINYFHSDGWFGSEDNRLFQRPYDILNASVNFTFGDQDRFNLRLWGKNITNTVYAAQFSAQPFGDAVHISPGRTFGATIGVEF